MPKKMLKNLKEKKQKRRSSLITELRYGGLAMSVVTMNRTTTRMTARKTQKKQQNVKS